jgi:multiple sugar transport system permease protein
MSAMTTAELERPRRAPSRSDQGAGPTRSRGRLLTDGRVGALLSFPAIAGVGLFTIVPAVLSVVASFFSVSLSAGGWSFVGLGNFRYLFTSAPVRQAMFNTVIYCAWTIVPSMAIGLGIALLATSLRRGSGLYRMLVFLPMTANLVAMSVVFNYLFAFQGGFANEALGWVGIEPLNFLGSPHLSLATIAAIGVWRSSALCMILYSGGLTTIPSTIHEAAATDGIRGFAKLRLVTLPMLRPTTIFVAVLSTLTSVQIFDTVNVMTQGGPLGSSQTVLPEAWSLGFQQFELGRAAALSSLMLAVLIGVGLLRRRAIVRGER